MGINKVVYNNNTLIDLSTDTVSSAADIVAGKIGHLRDGTQVTGTASGGGSTRFIELTFTTNASSGTQYITIPYTGSGYPIAAMVYIKNGAYNNTNTGDTNWYNSLKRYAVGQWTMHKAIQTTAPSYDGSGNENYGVTTTLYKNSTSNATTYSRTSSMNASSFYASQGASQTSSQVCRFSSNTEFSIYVQASSYGLLASTEYRAIIIYSA